GPATAAGDRETSESIYSCARAAGADERARSDGCRPGGGDAVRNAMTRRKPRLWAMGFGLRARAQAERCAALLGAASDGRGGAPLGGGTIARALAVALGFAIIAGLAPFVANGPMRAAAPAAASVAPPAPYGAVPSDRQLAWHELEMYAFL